MGVTMISATCPCGATFESDTGYYESDWKNMGEWLVMHQPCVNVKVISQELANKRASIMKHTISPDWKAGFQFLDNAAQDYNSFHFRPSGNVTCIECDYVQAKGESPIHSTNCSHYKEK